MREINYLERCTAEMNVKKQHFIALHKVQFFSQRSFHCAIYTVDLITSNFAKIFKDLIYSI